MVEYINQQINHLSWQIADNSTYIISGSKNSVSVWQFVDSPSTYDQLPIVEVSSDRSIASVCKVNLIGNLAFAATTSGSVILYEFDTESRNRKTLVQLSKTDNLHPNYKCNDMLFCAQTNSVITCGNDGSISRFNIEHPAKVVSNAVSDTSLKCMDMLTPNEIICGTMCGCLKHFDLRTNDCVGTYASKSFSSISSLQKNPNVNHLAVGGNDQGSIMLYDMRNENTALAEISAHSSAITCARYRPRDPNVLYSSSCDGELFKWNLSTEFTTNNIPRKVESIACTKDPLSITSFDINQHGDLIYTVDCGAIYYRKLSELNT